MNLQQIFWQSKVKPRQLVIDWDKFISLFEEFIFQTISIRLNYVQKEFIKSMIDPENKQLVYKNSYLLFVKNYWYLPSNRTKLLKGQINLTSLKQAPKLKFLSDLKDQENVLLRIKYIPDSQQCPDKSNQQNKASRNLCQKIFEFRKNKLYTLDPKLNIISQKIICIENFLSFGRNQRNDIAIEDCQYINSQHLKLVKIKTKKIKQKKPYYMFDDEDGKNQDQTHCYLRDVSKSNRLQYMITNDTTYVVMRPGLVVNIGMTEMYELHIVQATLPEVNNEAIKQIESLLNSDRIDYMGEIDQNIPQKFILDFPTQTFNNSDIQHWFNKGYHYEEPQTTLPSKTSMKADLTQDEDSLLLLRLVNKVTQQSKEYKLYGQSIKVGRSKNNHISIDKVSIREVECEFVCITGVWMVKNIPANRLHIPNANNQMEMANYNHKLLKLQQLSVSLTMSSSIQSLQSSNRIQLSSEATHEVKGKNFVITLTFPKIKS